MGIEDNIENDKTLVPKEETNIEKKVDWGYFSKLKSAAECFIAGGINGAVYQFVLVQFRTFDHFYGGINIDKKIDDINKKVEKEFRYDADKTAYHYGELIGMCSLAGSIIIYLTTPLAFPTYIIPWWITNTLGYFYYKRKREENQYLESTQKDLLEDKK